jgi:hypothetical protein
LNGYIEGFLENSGVYIEGQFFLETLKALAPSGFRANTNTKRFPGTIPVEITNKSGYMEGFLKNYYVYIEGAVFFLAVLTARPLFVNWAFKISFQPRPVGVIGRVRVAIGGWWEFGISEEARGEDSKPHVAGQVPVQPSRRRASRRRTWSTWRRKSPIRNKSAVIGALLQDDGDGEMTTAATTTTTTTTTWAGIGLRVESGFGAGLASGGVVRGVYGALWVWNTNYTI